MTYHQTQSFTVTNVATGQAETKLGYAAVAELLRIKVSTLEVYMRQHPQGIERIAYLPGDAVAKVLVQFGAKAAPTVKRGRPSYEATASTTTYVKPTPPSGKNKIALAHYQRQMDLWERGLDPY